MKLSLTAFVQKLASALGVEIADLPAAQSGPPGSADPSATLKAQADAQAKIKAATDADVIAMGGTVTPDGKYKL